MGPVEQAEWLLRLRANEEAVRDAELDLITLPEKEAQA